MTHSKEPQRALAWCPSRRAVGLGVALAGVVAAALVVSVRMELWSPPSVDAVDGIASIEEGVTASGSRSAIIPLTVHDGKIDLVFAGAPECSHCQAFVSKGLKEMIAFSEERELDFAYMPMAMSAVGVAIAASESCALKKARPASEHGVQEVYRSMESIRAAIAGAHKGREESAIWDEISGIHKRLSDGELLDEQCHAEASRRISKQMGDFADTFALSGTPSFYVDLDGGKVGRVTGRMDLEALEPELRQ